MWQQPSTEPTQQGHHHNGDQAARRPPHDVFNLWSPICDRSVWATCGVGNGSSRQPISNHLAAIWKGDFRPPVWGITGQWGEGLGMSQFDSPPIGSYELPNDPYGLSLTVFSYLARSKSVSARQTWIRRQIPLYKLRLRRVAKMSKW